MSEAPDEAAAVTESEIRSADPQLTLNVINAWPQSAQRMADHGDAYEGAVRAPEWEGATAGVVTATAARHNAIVVDDAATINALHRRATAAMDPVIRARTGVLGLIDDTRAGNRFTVTDDLKVTSPDIENQPAANAKEMEIRQAAQKWKDAETYAASEIRAGAQPLTGRGSQQSGDGRNGRIVLVDDDHHHGSDDRKSPEDEAVGRAAEPRNPVPDSGMGPPPIEGGTPGGRPYPGGLGTPVPGTALQNKPEPPAWQPKDAGAGPFRSWEPRNPGDLIAKKTAQGGAWWKEGEIPHAAQNMQHYFDVSGTPLQQDVRQMLNDLPDFQNTVNGDMQRLGAEAISRAQLSGTTGPLTFPVNTGWNGEHIPEDQRDWYLALGNFDYNLSGQVTVQPPSQPGGQWTYSLDGDVNIRDRYNWDIGKATPIMGTPITDAQMARFHLIGYAREFTMTGSTGIHGNG